MAGTSKKDRVPKYVSQEPESTGPSRNDLLNRYGLGGEGENGEGGETARERQIREWEEQQARKLQDGSGPSEGGAGEQDHLPETVSTESGIESPGSGDDEGPELTVPNLPAQADEHGYVAMPRFSAPTSEDKKERLQHYLRGIGAVEYAAKSNEQRVQQQRLLVLGEYITAMKQERAWEIGGYSTLGALLFEQFGIRKDYANKVERAVPVVRALESVTTMDLKERQLRVLVPVQREHGDDAVRKVWEEASRRGKLTEKSLEAAAKFLGFGPPEVTSAKVTEKTGAQAEAASAAAAGSVSETRTSGGGGGAEGGGPLPVAEVLQRIRELRSTDEEQAKVMLKELMTAVEELRAEMGLEVGA
ncbi:hypothetical protein AB0393_28175 [Streptomyces cyaneofuscatus]|uniref:hypothetical protein n=1 Tax=Streptomyces cyaneofuscatus TaxID=66883 RepID=UPI00344D63BA